MNREFIDDFLKPLYTRDGEMTEEMFNALTPDEWSDYKYGGDYVKGFFDIEDADGNIYENVYPNAGQFRVSLKNGAGRIIKVKDIKRFRLTKSDY